MSKTLQVSDECLCVIDRIGDLIVEVLNWGVFSVNLKNFFNLSLFIASLLLATNGWSQTSENYDVQINLPQSLFKIEFDTKSKEFEFFKNELSEAEKASFLNTRKDLLHFAAKALQSLKFGLGFGVVLKDKIQFIAQKKEIHELYDEVQLLQGSHREDRLLALQKYEDDFNDRFKQKSSQSLKEKVDFIIVNVLRNLDAKLWSQSSLVAHSNEFGFMVSVGAIAEGGKNSGQGWGGLADIGISIGYNKDQKAFVFQVFRDVEKFSSTEMPTIFLAGFVGKAGFLMTKQHDELHLHGITFYPPVAPAYSMTSPRSFSIGGSTGLTWPPSPLGDLLTYSNQFQQNTWLRVTVSPLVKGYVRRSSNLMKDVKTIQLLSVDLFLKLFKKLKMSSFGHGPNSMSCQALF